MVIVIGMSARRLASRARLFERDMSDRLPRMKETTVSTEFPLRREYTSAVCSLTRRPVRLSIAVRTAASYSAMSPLSCRGA